MPRKHHYIKCETNYYQQTEQSLKNYEVRKNDRDYKVGDFVYLQEIVGKTCTGREINGRKIISILHDYEFKGLKDGYCIFELEKEVENDE